MTGLRAVAWDIDGTLVDSEDLHHRALVTICGAHGVDLSDLPAQAFRGVHMFDVWTSLRPRLPARLDRGEWLDAVDRYYVGHAAEVAPMPEAIATVRELGARGIAQACVSNSGRAVVDANIDALGIRDQIAFSISLDDVSAGKPDPEPFARAARRFEVPFHAVAAVEDSVAGARSARGAGLVVVRYTRLGERGGEGDHWIGRLSEILEMFAG